MELEQQVSVPDSPTFPQLPSQAQPTLEALYSSRQAYLEEHPDVDMLRMDTMAVIRCPCSKIVAGPFHFFQHVKEDHKDDSLEDIYTRRTIKRVQERQDGLDVVDFAILENAEDSDFARRVNRVAQASNVPRTYPSYLSRPSSLNRKRHDWVMYHFYLEAGGNEQSKQVILVMFDLIKQVLGTQPQDAWMDEPVESLPLVFSDLMRRASESNGWKGLDVFEVRELLFSYCKWLLLKGHTRHRVMKQPSQYPERVESEQVKIEDEWPRKGFPPRTDKDKPSFLLRQ